MAVKPKIGHKRKIKGQRKDRDPHFSNLGVTAWGKGRKPDLLRYRQMVREYLRNGFNKKRAADYAGFTDSQSYSSTLFKRDDVKAILAEEVTKMEKTFDVTKDKIINELAKIAFNRTGDLLVEDDHGHVTMDLTGMTMEQRATLTEFTVEEYKEGRGPEAPTVKKTKVKFADKKAALDSLARIFGMNQDKQEVSGSLSIEQALAAGRNRMKEGGK